MSKCEGDVVEETKEKRLNTLLGVWSIVTQRGLIPGDRMDVNHAVLSEVVAYYLSDLSVIKHRYRIQGKISPYKIAGLTTAAILRFRPVSLRAGDYKGDSEVYANEIFAIIHGLSICGEDVHALLDRAVVRQPWFRLWMKDFVFLLHHRNYTSESLIMIYETLCLASGKAFEEQTL